MRKHRWRRSWPALVLLVASGATSAGCGEVVALDEFERAAGVAAPVQPPPTTAPETLRLPEVLRGAGPGLVPGAPAPGPAPASAPDATPLGFGDGVLVIEAGLADLEGERSLVQVVLYEGYGIVTSLSSSSEVDRVVVRSSGNEQPTAMPNAMVQDPVGSRFAMTDIDWSIIPGLVERTPTDLGIEGGKVSHVIVEKNLPFSPDLVIRVYVSTDRRSGRIDYFADGRVLRAFPG